MALDARTLANINLVVQALLALGLLAAAYFAKIKHDLKTHCLVLRVLVPVQIVAIAIIMLPATIGYLQQGERTLLFRSEILTHHTLGLAVVAIWVYVNLVRLGFIRGIGRLATAMRLAFFLWLAVLLFGGYLYFVTWIA